MAQLYFHPSNIANPMSIQQLTEVILSPIYNVRIYKHITILILYQISSTLKVPSSEDVPPSRSCMSRCIGGTYCYSHLLTGSSLANFSTLKVEVMCSSEASVHTKSTWHNIPENGILHSHRCENLKSYIVLDWWHCTCTVYTAWFNTLGNT
jgi:hypothetical protein